MTTMIVVGTILFVLFAIGVERLVSETIRQERMIDRLGAELDAAEKTLAEQDAALAAAKKDAT